MQRRGKARNRKATGLPQVPGQEIEGAAAEVASAAGKSLIRGFARLARAALDKWMLTKEAEAEAASLAIKTRSQLRQNRSLTKHRREMQLEEQEHQALLLRRADRLRTELVFQQANLEAIQSRSLEIANAELKSEAARDLDDDWMFKFARFAQEISDRDVQEMWARILCSAAVESRPMVSAAALQAMSLIDSQTARDFTNFHMTCVTFNLYPSVAGPFGRINEPQQIDLMNLRELGMIEASPVIGIYPFRDFEIQLGPPAIGYRGPTHSTFQFALRGIEIAKAIFADTDNVGLSSELERKYLEEVVASHMRQRTSIAILPLDESRKVLAYAFSLTHPPDGLSPQKKGDWDFHVILSPRLKSLIDWAGNRYNILRGPLPMIVR